MGALDLAVKALLLRAPRPLLGLALPDLTPRTVVADDVQLAGTDRRVDKLLRVRAWGGAALRVHVEVQTAWRADVPARCFRYWSHTVDTVDDDQVLSVVLVLKRGARQGRPRGAHAVAVLGRRALRFRFVVVRAWRLDAARLLAEGQPGLLPLVPFARGATHERIERAIAALEAPRHIELLGALVVFAGNVFPGVRWHDMIPKERLMKSTVYDALVAEIRPKLEAEITRKVTRKVTRRVSRKARAEGQAEGRAEVVARLLRSRLNGRADAFVARLQGCPPATLDAVADLVVGRPRLGSAALVRALEGVLPAR